MSLFRLISNIGMITKSDIITLFIFLDIIVEKKIKNKEAKNNFKKLALSPINNEIIKKINMDIIKNFLFKK